MSGALPQPNDPTIHTPTPAPMALTGKQKAAVIVRLALANGAQLKLDSLPLELQSTLIEQMTELRHIDQATIDAVVIEFLDKFDAAGLSFPGALADTLDFLKDVISPEVATRLKRQAGLSLHSDPWLRIGDKDNEVLLPVIEAESVEVAAVILSKLKVSKAAELLGQMPGDRARRIAYAISLTGTISPRVVEAIGQTIAEQFDDQPATAFEDGPVERVGAILNFSPSSTRDEVLDGLAKEDAEFADEVRKSIFTFANIPERIDPRDVPRVVRDVEQEDLIRALAGAEGQTASARDFILENMSKRMADQLREEMQELGSVKPADAEASMTRIVVAIRELEAAGEIFLVALDED